ncbi:MAG TPA: PilZ domain-containing protein [Sphingomicrobium sp.]|nr:PilZ domain-containing protein [Sphingomicrobium sp.]
MKQQSSECWPERPERHQVSRRGFAMSKTRDADVLVTDLSYEGCRIESSETFELGERFDLRVLGLGSADAEIRWTANGLAGVRFTA